MTTRQWLFVLIVAILLAFLAGTDFTRAATFIEATGVAAEAGEHVWRLMGVALLALIAVFALAAFLHHRGAAE